LNPNTGFTGVNVGNNPWVVPFDTYDGADVGADRSLGVVDDTCEVRIEVSLPLPAPVSMTLTAAANVFVGPPDFGPDRRPFLSLADELNDRSADSTTRSAAMSDNERDAWVQDLFERIYETVSLFNVDFWRSQGNVPLSGSRLRPLIPDDHTPNPTRSMGGRDALRNPQPIEAPTPNVPLPISERARGQHRLLSDLQQLRDFVQQSKGRLRSLIRPPFEVESVEVDAQGAPRGSTMRMPPFMLNSSRLPLTLTGWQYDLLMDWVTKVENPPPIPEAVTAAAPTPRPMSERALRHRTRVLARLRG
jgi:hypothetical protein